jgi:hypothetical protein
MSRLPTLSKVVMPHLLCLFKPLLFLQKPLVATDAIVANHRLRLKAIVKLFPRLAQKEF